jgi:CheY-like chemotaxis protein
MARADAAGPQAAAAAVPAPPAPGPVLDRPLSVLVVEDNPANRMVLEELLLTLGHTADLAVDGAEGVAKARARSYDLILMDLSMPRIDGWTATALIREDGASQGSRILAVTANALTRDDARFPTSGFDGLLTKPLTMEDVSAALLSSDAAAPAGVAGGAAPPLLHEARLDDLARLGAAPLRRMLDQARQDLARCLASAAAATTDPQACAAHLHEAAGVAALIGAGRLHALLRDGEEACHAADLRRIDRSCESLAAVWAETERSLDGWHGRHGPHPA